MTFFPWSWAVRKWEGYGVFLLSGGMREMSLLAPSRGVSGMVVYVDMVVYADMVLR